MEDSAIAIRNFGQAEARTFPNGRFELCQLGGHSIGRARKRLFSQISKSWVIALDWSSM